VSSVVGASRWVAAVLRTRIDNRVTEHTAACTRGGALIFLFLLRERRVTVDVLAPPTRIPVQNRST